MGGAGDFKTSLTCYERAQNAFNSSVTIDSQAYAADLREILLTVENNISTCKMEIEGSPTLLIDLFFSLSWFSYW